MVNVSESVLKVVSRNKRNWLLRLNQKVCKIVGKSHESYTTRILPAESRHLTQQYSISGTWKPCISLREGEDSKLQNLPTGMQVWDVGKSECWFVMNQIQV